MVGFVIPALELLVYLYLLTSHNFCMQQPVAIGNIYCYSFSWG